MDSDQGKLFIGGISWETSEERLKDYFSSYGDVLNAVIMRDKLTGRPRGFGFVVFAEASVLDRVLQDKHSIDGRTVEAKRALSREEQQTTARSGNPSSGGSGGASIRTKKIFVGGLPSSITEDGFRQYFESYGTVTDVVVMYDPNTHRPRGFGFITFESEDIVDQVLHKTFHDLGGKQVEVKRALPKDANPINGGGRSSGAGSYQSYSGANGNSGSYDGRMDGNRYVQPQTGGGGYPPYGSSGYGTPGYGYGASNNGVGYGGYGVGYGNPAAGYGGPAGAYGNPNAPGGTPGGPRSPWGTQPPTGYGSSGYGGNAGYGAGSSWNLSTGTGESGAPPTGQSPSGVAAYGNQGYGYGGYGGSEWPYGNQGGYGSASGRGGGAAANNPGASSEQVSGYMGGGYGDANANSGYPNSWRSVPSQGGTYGASQMNSPTGGPASYGGGYGGPQGSQAQQQ